MPEQTPDALAKKLRLTPETRLLALNAPEMYLAALGQRAGVADIATKASKGGAFDAVHLFARTQEEAAAALPVATAALRADGVLWVMWPKQSSGVATDLTRDTLAALAGKQGWGPVSNVSIDDTWSALRLRPEADVKRAGKTWPPSSAQEL
jgi:hypothetical protein